MKQDFFKQNRERVLQQIQGGVAILPAAPETTYSHDVHHKYRQNSDFYYLTGLREPEAVVVLAPQHQHPFTLFVRPRDRDKEIWNGFRQGLEGAMQHFGADIAYSIQDLTDKLPEYLENTQALYYQWGFSETFDRQVQDALKKTQALIRAGISAPRHMTAPGVLLHEMRLFKRPEEIELMQQAADITADAHQAAMRAVRPGLYEFGIEALIEYRFKQLGATGPGYPSIIGGGLNATVLHYIENRDCLRDGELLLIDAGAEYQYYNADLTRTIPVNGRFSPVQRQVYQAVLVAQQQAIAAVQPGHTFMQVHEAALDTLVDGLLDLKLLSGSRQENLEKESYKKFFMHKTSHWLGIDVHDAGDYKRGDAWRPLEPGMVLTVEPGLYFGPHLEQEVPAEFLGIGIRIEDDVLVTAEGHRVLTAAAPKEVSDIEALMQG